MNKGDRVKLSAFGRQFLYAGKASARLGTVAHKPQRHIWTDGEKEFLSLSYPHLPTSEIARAIGRPVRQIYAQAKKLGLSKTEAYLASPDACRLRRGPNPGVRFRYPKGHVPANKGLRRPGYAVGRMKETQFKKGQKPGNTLPIGTIAPNGDGYLRIKVKDEPQSIAGKGALSTNWEFVHRRVWEAAHGPIPEGHRIWWKDGNHQNNDLDNLELLNAEEHMARTTIHTFPPELKETLQLKGQLNRAITMKVKKEKHNGVQGPEGPA